MNRRLFLASSVAAALVGGVPVVQAVSLGRQGLLEAPEAWLGERFRLVSGQVLQLAAVEAVGCDVACEQSTLQFRVIDGSAVPEGIHELRCGSASESLYLQSGRAGPVACLNRLRWHSA